MEKMVGIAALFTLLLSGCGGSVDSVKNGTLNGYETTTIGKAVDNYSYALQTKWEGFDTKNGQEVVEAKIELKFPPFCEESVDCNDSENLQNFLDFGFGAHVYPEWRQKVDSDSKSKTCTQPEAYSGNIEIQFLINKNGGFQTSYVGLEYFIQDEVTKDCKYLTTAQLLLNSHQGQQLYTNILDAIYSDQPIY